MSAVQKLQNSNPANFIVQKYIDQVLQETAQEIYERQERVAADSTVDVDDILRTRKYHVTPGQLSLSHNIEMRFLDMKPRWKNLRQVQLYNSQIWGEFNILAGKIAYGFTETIRQTIAQRYNIDING
ncbi:hypothetical protein [Leeuwenhoekiella sp. CH_XMU1409-2]|uniref:hypothetical protein n=1 Tax=Leeuwenhoekiella sp. CH_XMU1409-2 TaxID=3107768 RepID=UPI0030082E2D